jgi:hypothetical protein
VRQRSGATLSARTVGESLCMSKSVEAHLQGPDSERQGPTNRMSAAKCSLVVPTVRAPRFLTEPSAKSPQKQPMKRPEREGRRGQPAPGSAFPRDAAIADQRPMTRTLHLPPLRAEATAGLATDFGIIHCGSVAWSRPVRPTQQRHRHQNHSGIHQARPSVWPRRRVSQKEKLMRTSSVRASSLTPEPLGPDPEI